MTVVPARPARLARRATVVGATLLVALVIGLAGCATTAPSTAEPGAAASASGATLAALPAEVSVQNAASLRDAGAFVLDVREPDEWAAGHIPGATLIPLGELASRTSEVPRNRDVVVVCRSGNRSAQGRDILLGAGLPAVTSMAGGMNAWTAAGLPTEPGS